VKREIIRVEPLSTYLENWKAPTSAVTRSGDTIYVSGFPPFDPATGKVTTPKEIREAANLQPGDRIHFTALADGTIIVRAKTRGLRDLAVKPPRRKRVSVEEMSR
jgi:AbrB family looped-hinge helix DNA binding protein